jgi:hypothetical protein
MDPGLRRAWTEIVTADDYDAHMASIGQAAAAAALTAILVASASLRPGSSIAIAAAGTGQMFDFLDPGLFRPYRLTCTDLNPAYLARLDERLAARGLSARMLVDDIEQTALEPGPDLLLATLLLEHIDWRRGVEAFAGLRPRWCAVIIQENPPDMAEAVTPGRPLPPSIAKAIEIGRPALVASEQLEAAMAASGYFCRERAARGVADAKRLVGMLFENPLAAQRDESTI